MNKGAADGAPPPAATTTFAATLELTTETHTFSTPRPSTSASLALGPWEVQLMLDEEGNLLMKALDTETAKIVSKQITKIVRPPTFTHITSSSSLGRDTESPLFGTALLQKEKR